MLREILNAPEIEAILDAQGESTYIGSLEHKSRFISIIKRHVLIDAPRSLIEELKNGLKTLGVLDKILAYPEQFRDLFTSENVEPLDAQSVDLLFQITYAEKGSNTRSAPLFSGEIIFKIAEVSKIIYLLGTASYSIS